MAFGESENPLRIAIQRAAKSGWSLNLAEPELTNDILVLHLAIDSNFWQALAATEQWSEWEPHRPGSSTTSRMAETPPLSSRTS